MKEGHNSNPIESEDGSPLRRVDDKLWIGHSFKGGSSGSGGAMTFCPPQPLQVGSLGLKEIHM